MEVIDRQAAIDTEGLDEEIRCEMCKNPMHTDRGCDGYCEYDEKLYEKIMQILNERIKPLPSAQPEQRKARWKSDGLTDYRCSLCGWLNTSRKKTNYCGNCGAMMYNDDPSHPFADDVMMRGEEDG